MAIQNFPNIIPDSENWGVMYNSQVFTSVLTGSTQVAELDGAKWKATLVFTNRYGRDARALRALLLKLRGRVGTFYLTPNDSERLGTANGAGVTNGAIAQGGGNTVVTDGWLSNQSLLFAAGDWISINNELKQITEDVSSDVNGEATLSFEPPLRSAVPDGTTIVKDNPRAIMRLKSDNEANWDTTSPIIYAMSIECVEVIT